MESDTSPGAGPVRRRPAAALAPVPVTVPSSKPSSAAPFDRGAWLALSVASGSCAAFNGALAKLTTGKVTSSLVAALARFCYLEAQATHVDLLVRLVFVVANVFCTGLVWTFFTAALARGPSATHVTVLNTSSNLLVAALIGLVLFGESLPPLWWAGIGLAIVGNVVIVRARGVEPERTD